ncbi:MAG: type secretion system protein [Candidatus Brocadiaceae bacterium]|nr:type secretion system protein [Candidatus Brocadiaceae bacterium]
METRKKIGEVLVETKIISQQQLDQAIAFQKGKNKRIGKILVELGVATEKQIAEALADALSIPLVNCREYTLDGKQTSLVPRAMIETRIIMPLEVKGNTLLVAMVDPLDWETIDSLALITGMRIIPAVTYETNLLEAIEKQYGTYENIIDMIEKAPVNKMTSKNKEKGFFKLTKEYEKEVNVEALHKMSETPTVIRLVTTLIFDAVKMMASDIHIDPTENNVMVRFVINGELKDILNIPKNLQGPVIARIKIISNMDITNRKLPQDGKSSMKIGIKDIDLKISTTPSIYGEKIVIRILDKTNDVWQNSR